MIRYSIFIGQMHQTRISCIVHNLVKLCSLYITFFDCLNSILSVTVTGEPLEGPYDEIYFDLEATGLGKFFSVNCASMV